MDSANLRRKDTTKGPPLRILSLDGGGVRGYSMLILLQELMHRTYVEAEGRAPRRDQIPKPCDHFDLIAGTGTGGLIAIMLGRLRLDLETCKDVYVRMTKRVFETDKTIAGIPYRSTLFKASKLEEAIRECVREHTLFEEEGSAAEESGRSLHPPMSPMSPMTPGSALSGPHRSMSRGSTTTVSSVRSPGGYRASMVGMKWGDPNAPLYDARENRTKTAVAAVYKGTPKNGAAALLRSYDSRKEPPPEFNCTIWQAGRATSATGLAFKPIQIGHSVFIDEGAGKYNPAPQMLDEAMVNEWPGRDVGVFVSIGTGKRPSGTAAQQHLWWEGFVSGGIGDFAEARRRLINKIEGCEDTHQYMLREHLSKRGVNPENYYRLNVEVGVGEFGMNEWNRLADISTNTRRYLGKSEVQRINMDAAAKLGRIQRSINRQTRYANHPTYDAPSYNEYAPPANPLAVELPGPDIPSGIPRPRPGPQYPEKHTYNRIPPNPQDTFAVISSDEFPQPVDSENPPPPLQPQSQSHSQSHSQPRRSAELAPPHSAGAGSIENGGVSPASPRRSGEGRLSPPPLPPKTPLPYAEDGNGRDSRRYLPPRDQEFSRSGQKLPYPEADGPPPVINMARKPEYSAR
ncbi:MAG: hypothetical protein M4579_006035 [Chaenotheca gracillima]|nr:MAG: hypothetical protein M4579_006035 [Chaenotheca gracillima]